MVVRRVLSAPAGSSIRQKAATRRVAAAVLVAVASLGPVGCSSDQAVTAITGSDATGEASSSAGPTSSATDPPTTATPTTLGPPVPLRQRRSGPVPADLELAGCVVAGAIGECEPTERQVRAWAIALQAITDQVQPEAAKLDLLDRLLTTAANEGDLSPLLAADVVFTAFRTLMYLGELNSATVQGLVHIDEEHYGSARPFVKATPEGNAMTASAFARVVAPHIASLAVDDPAFPELLLLSLVDQALREADGFAAGRHINADPKIDLFFDDQQPDGADPRLGRYKTSRMQAVLFAALTKELTAANVVDGDSVATKAAALVLARSGEANNRGPKRLERLAVAVGRDHTDLERAAASIDAAALSLRVAAAADGFDAAFVAMLVANGWADRSQDPTVYHSIREGAVGALIAPMAR